MQDTGTTMNPTVRTQVLDWLASQQQAMQDLLHKRIADLNQWVAPYAPLVQSIQLLLQMLRESGTTQKVMATSGLLQQTLPQGRTFQLLRLKIDPALGITPEISCNRLLVVIRMMRQQADGRLQSCTDEVPFEMALCA
eukprot:gene32294-39873_t